MVSQEKGEGLEYSQLLGVMSKEAERGQIRGLKATLRFRNHTFVGAPGGLPCGFSPAPLPSWTQERKMPTEVSAGGEY